jgi:hypothetical protein
MLTRIKQIVCAQFIKDEAALVRRAGGDPDTPISLLAKWIPREGHPMAIHIIVSLVPGQMFHGTRVKLYRKRVSALNRALGTLEIKMCANEWDAITMSDVPLLARKKYANAFNKVSRMGACQQVTTPLPRDPSRYNLVRERVRKILTPI